MSTLNVDKVDPNTGTALEIGSSGDTITVPSGATLDISASTLTPPATMPASSAANLTNIPGANITGTIAAVSGANLTSLNATNLGSGTVPTARLGTGTASSSTVLYGDQTYKAEPGGVNTPLIYIKVGSNQSVSDNTITKVEFDTEIFDTEGSFDSSTNYRWTPQTAGKYYICAGVGMTAFGVDQLNETSIYIYKNGSKDMQSRITTATHYLYWLTPVVSSIVDMNGSSDYVEIMGLSDFISATVSFQASSHSFLCGYKLIE